ncbi:MAG: hypothetical protein ONB05_08240 [candidate division KSB1 bacterium]|nr:hypothetical protein [candidate division KSB1 bacterium]
MKKFQLLGHRALKDTVVNTLRQMGNVHISDARNSIPESQENNILQDVEIKDPALEERLAQLQYLIDFTAQYYEKPKGLQSMFNPRLVVTKTELEKIVQEFDVQVAYSRCQDWEDRIKNTQAEKGKKLQLQDELQPWLALDAPLEELRDTEYTRILLGITRFDTWSSLSSTLAEITSEFDLQVIQQTKSSVSFVLLFSKEYTSQILDVLKQLDCQLVQFEKLTGTPAQALRHLEKEVEQLEQTLIELEGQCKEFTSNNRNKILALYDFTANELDKIQVQNHFAHTEGTFFLEGWIRERDEKRIRERLSQISPEIEIITQAPEAGENPPITFDNKPFVSSFEFITTLFSRPDYREYDPTPLFAPFFVLFFALCLGDGGYGMVLAGISLLALKKLKLSEGNRKLFKVMVYGGLLAVPVGLLTGGIFGIDVASLPKPLQKIVIINPLENPMGMLKFSFVLGFFQILTGLAIKGVRNFRDNRPLAAILDQGLWIVFLIFLAPLGYSFILGGEISPEVANIAQKGSLVCTIGVVLTGGRHQKGMIKKLLTGVTKLYSIAGYLGDVLSYARLLALGLATSAIA